LLAAICSSNASKINRARAEAAKKASEEKAGGGGSKGMAARKGTDALTLQCAICKVCYGDRSDSAVAGKLRLCCSWHLLASVT
jgi:hypothetical protein